MFQSIGPTIRRLLSRSPFIPFISTEAGAQTRRGLFCDGRGNLLQVVTPYPLEEHGGRTVRIGIMAGAFTYDRGGDSKPVREEFRLYAYILGYRFAEAGLGDIRFLINYGGGENGMMADFAWGARDAYAAHGLKGSNVCAINVSHFWNKRDSRAAINDHLYANIICRGYGGGFDIRKKLINQVDAIIVLPGGRGTFDELTDGENKAQQGEILAKIFLANLAIERGGKMSGFFDGHLAQIKTCFEEGFTPTGDEDLMHVEKPADDFENHMQNLLEAVYSNLKIDKSALPEPASLGEIIQSYKDRHRPRPCASKNPLTQEALNHYLPC